MFCTLFHALNIIMYHQVAGKTNDVAGDGTTTASVLARELIKYGLQSVTAGRNPVALKRGMDKACAALVEKLEALSQPVNGTDDIRAVASISAGNDDEIGRMIADAIEKVRREIGICLYFCKRKLNRNANNHVSLAMCHNKCSGN